MKALGILLILLAIVMSAQIVVGLINHDPKLRIEVTTFLSPVLILLLGVAAVRRSKTARAKRDGFSL